MIIVDSSALIAVLEKETDAAIYAKAMKDADRLLISAVNVHETGIVMHARHGVAACNRMWGFIQVDNDFEIIAFDEAQAREALSAFGALRQRHRCKGSTQPCRLCGLCSRENHECALVVQGKRLHRNRHKISGIKPKKCIAL